MVATPLFELPQAWEIYSTQNAASVSLSTWAFFSVSNLAWIAYAVRHRMKILVVVYSMYLVIEMAIVVGILLYS